MKGAARRAILSVSGAAVLSLLGMALATGQAGGPQGGQSAPPDKPLMAEDVFTNVQLLRGIPVDEFMDTMGMFAAATGLNCTDCHVQESGGNWARYADDVGLKQTARRMIVMVNNLNRSSFGGRRVVTCYTCHRGLRRPSVIPSLALQYSTAAPEDPDEIFRQAPGAPSADEVLDKYIQAIGGMQRLANLTSFVANGTYQAYDDSEKYPFEVYAKAPGQRTTILHSSYGDVTTTYDGHSGWLASPQEMKPLPVIALSGGNLEGAAVDAALSFPGRIKQSLNQWRVGPLSSIDDRDVQLVQGSSAEGLPVKLYFDDQSGLLVRLVRYTDSPVGRVPTQVDYSDYRDVSGIKTPFKWTATWTDGRTNFELTSVQPNVPIDSAKFAKPAAPTAPKVSAQ